MKITKAIASAPVIRVAPGEYLEYPEDAMFNLQSGEECSRTPFSKLSAAGRPVYQDTQQ
jgi:hypothetical protein